MNFSTKQGNLNIDNSPINNVNNYKYLGCKIDNNLTFDLHINNIYNTIKKGIKALYVCKEDSFKKSVFCAFIMSHVTYALSIWGNKNIKKLIDFQSNVMSKFNIDYPSISELISQSV